jgi:hypothetical protein
MQHHMQRVPATLACSTSGQHTGGTACLLTRAAHAAADDVHVTGVVIARWRPMFPGARCDAELCLSACHLAVARHKHKAAVEVPEQLVDM